ncbi:hypothetical protein CAOG_00280 [Capsaspora owczarzaki ATCC 30864]|uniref:Hemerythrin-like domain-containing protein n=1 Tax=Capsaspora owczarzaki (strain ATCC 30864) TaxID=595528 RepID=A0A0D2WIA2_CAPO3|nr:hypothetical protein CAOG_00280 [Capsaspora owczarzaki ATCC 30864]KJE88673.1 hypothetical protein CAOG_000280 [Capsaspora owczarzaki ATCC 30864]|eukprot:XP_004365151.1 hypothetical protein CAOG_00280 [Capsaspora owczarzaki ATCC 30864]
MDQKPEPTPTSQYPAPDAQPASIPQPPMQPQQYAQAPTQPYTQAPPQPYTQAPPYVGPPSYPSSPVVQQQGQYYPQYQQPHQYPTHTALRPYTNTGDGLQLLLWDHAQLRAFADQYHAASSQGERNTALTDFMRHLTIHESAEEQYLYPLIRTKIPGAEILLDRTVLEDSLCKQLLEFLEAHISNMYISSAQYTDASDKNKPGALQPHERERIFNESAEKLLTLTLEHLRSEEDRVIRPLEQLLKPQERSTLETNLLWAKKLAPTHTHSWTAASKGHSRAARVLNPVAGVVDRVSDALNIGTRGT